MWDGSAAAQRLAAAETAELADESVDTDPGVDL
jgi:hypothetical protein